MVIFGAAGDLTKRLVVPAIYNLAARGNRDHIDHVQITATETIGVELRGKFYERTGAMRDMVPNHLFQLLAMTAMEPPNSFEANAARLLENEGRAWRPINGTPLEGRV
jgi:glucose-6-phosphate 1-dehydrogenase